MAHIEPDKNIKDLQSGAAIKTLKQIAEDAGMCMFATKLTEQPITSRPMAILEVDEWGYLYFMCKADSNKVTEMAADDRVQLFVGNESASEYLSIYGTAEVYRDQKTIDRLWNFWVKTWFNEGKDDPIIRVIKVKPESIYYWDTKNNKMVALAKIAIGAITGNQLDDGVEGHLKVMPS